MLLQRLQEISKPLKGGRFGTDPIEVDLLQSKGGVLASQLVVDGLEDGGEWCHSNTSAYTQTNLVEEYILKERRGRRKGEREGRREGGGKEG